MLYYLTPNRKSELVLSFLLFGEGGLDARPYYLSPFGLRHRRAAKLAGVGDRLKIGQSFGGCPQATPASPKFGTGHINSDNRNFGDLALVAGLGMKNCPFATACGMQPNNAFLAFGAVGVKSVGFDALKVSFGGRVVEFQVG